jgi:hypothetical protein
MAACVGRACGASTAGAGARAVAHLPGPTDADAITADVKDGVLAVRIPKPEEARPRRIEVRGENGSRSQG